MEEQLIDFIEKEFIDDNDNLPLDNESDLLTSELIDSMGMIRLVSFIEEKINKKIPIQDLVIDNFKNVNAICNYLKKLD